MCSRPVLLLGKYNSRFRPLWHRLRPVLLLELDKCESAEGEHHLLEGVPVIFDRTKQFACAVIVEAPGTFIIGLNLCGWR